MVFNYAVSFVLLIAAVVFFTGKAADYMKGYQTMPEAEKVQINIKALCRNLSVMFLTAAVIFGVTGYSEVFRELYFRWAMLGWFVLGILDLVFISKSKRYEKEVSSRN